MSNPEPDVIRGPFRLLFQESDGTWNNGIVVPNEDMSEAWEWAQSVANKTGQRVELCGFEPEPGRVIYGFRKPNANL